MDMLQVPKHKGDPQCWARPILSGSESSNLGSSKRVLGEQRHLHATS